MNEIRRGAHENRRREPRYNTDIECRLNFKGHEVWGRIVDLSRSGCGLQLLVPMLSELGREIDFIEIDRIGRLPCYIRWRSQDRIGVEFSGGRDVTEKIDKFIAELFPGPPPGQR